MFTKEDKRGFKYWFAHWCAFQMVALNCKAWKLKYIFHDAEKPWLEILWKHEKVKQFHRLHSRHHLTYRGKRKIDYEALVIDWECSRYTKVFRKENAREVALLRLGENKITTKEYNVILSIINKFGL